MVPKSPVRRRFVWTSIFSGTNRTPQVGQFTAEPRTLVRHLIQEKEWPSSHRVADCRVSAPSCISQWAAWLVVSQNFCHREVAMRFLSISPTGRDRSGRPEIPEG